MTGGGRVVWRCAPGHSCQHHVSLLLCGAGMIGTRHAVEGYTSRYQNQPPWGIVKLPRHNMMHPSASRATLFCMAQRHNRHQPRSNIQHCTADLERQGSLVAPNLNAYALVGRAVRNRLGLCNHVGTPRAEKPTCKVTYLNTRRRCA